MRLQLPAAETPLFEDELARLGLGPEDERLARSFHRDGYLVLERLFSAERIDRVIAEVAPLLAGEEPDPRRHPNRFQDAWQESAAVRELATDERILGLLARLYGRRPIPFQTLNFERGTEQAAHADTIHFSSFPRRFLCGVWVALEDVGPANGTLFYYPGSHLLPDYDYNDLGLRQINHNRPGALEALTYADHEEYERFVAALMAAHGLERTALEARKGTVLIWAAGLVHGGSPILDPGSTRWSQVTHYYFEDCLYYAPICSNLVTGDLHLKRVVDVATGEPVTHRYHGHDLPPIERDGTFKLYLDDLGGRDAVALISNPEIKRLKDDNRYLRGVEEENANLRAMRDRLEAAIRDVERSPSYRLARLVSAPLRALRRLRGQRT